MPLLTWLNSGKSQKKTDAPPTASHEPSYRRPPPSPERGPRNPVLPHPVAEGGRDLRSGRFGQLQKPARNGNLAHVTVLWFLGYGRRRALFPPGRQSNGPVSRSVP